MFIIGVVVCLFICLIEDFLYGILIDIKILLKKIDIVCNQVVKKSKDGNFEFD